MNTGKTHKPKPLPAWTQHRIVFVRRGATAAVRAEARATGARVVTFSEIVNDLDRLPEKRLR